jgi:hypothetical protein
MAQVLSKLMPEFKLQCCKQNKKLPNNNNSILIMIPKAEETKEKLI